MASATVRVPLAMMGFGVPVILPDALPPVCGIGWRHGHEAALLEERPCLPFIEVHSENYFQPGGAARQALLHARGQGAQQQVAGGRRVVALQDVDVAVRRVGSFGPVGHLPQPWQFSETFLYNDDLKFQLRTLAEAP